MMEPASSVSNLLYGVIGLQVTTLAGYTIIIAKGSKIWTRLIDRVDALHQEYCTKHGIPFKPIMNGKHDD